MDSLRISGFSSPHVANVSRNAVGNTISRATDTNDFPKPPLDIMEQSATEPQARIGEMTISACLSDGRVEQVNFMELLHRCANSPTVMNGILQEPGVMEMVKTQRAGFETPLPSPYAEVENQLFTFTPIISSYTVAGQEETQGKVFQYAGVEVPTLLRIFLKYPAIPGKVSERKYLSEKRSISTSLPIR